MPRSSVFTLKASADDLDLSVLLVEPDVQPRCIVQMVHGMCEHKERYLPLMEFLAANGCICVMNDHRGHGASVKCADDLGYMYDGGWKALVEDLKVVTDWAKTSFPDLPLVLFGHSMGSLAVRSYTKRWDDGIRALIVCGCASDNPAKGAAKLMAAGFGKTKGWHFRPQLLQKLSFGAYNKPFAGEGYASAWVCSDRDVLEAYHKDPLCQYVFTANGWYNLMGLMEDCYGRSGWKMGNSRMPVHFISGAEDPCRTDDKAFYKAVDLMRSVGYCNVDAKLYAGMRHEIHNETARQTVWDDILSFIDAAI